MCLTPVLVSALARGVPDRHDPERRAAQRRCGTVNAKSVFRLDCLNSECVGGDFDLSQVLADAYAEHRATVVGEMHCQGWANKNAIGTGHCESVLRYKLSLRYGQSFDACVP